MLSFKKFMRLPPEIRTQSIEAIHQYIEKTSVSGGNEPAMSDRAGKF
jgi:hypothetical protein